MGKAPSRRLKVFVAQIGFYDTVVAAASQAANIERRKAVTAAVVEALQAYHNAGGSD